VLGTVKSRTECGFSCELCVSELGGCAVNCLRHHFLFLISPGCNQCGNYDLDECHARRDHQRPGGEKAQEIVAKISEKHGNGPSAFLMMRLQKQKRCTGRPTFRAYRSSAKLPIPRSNSVIININIVVSFAREDLPIRTRTKGARCESVEESTMGNALQSGNGRDRARQA